MNSLACRYLFCVLVAGFLSTQARKSFAEGDYRSCPEGYEYEAIKQVNIIRQSHGLKLLAAHPSLMRSSGMRAYTVTVTEKLNHNGWKDSITQVGFGNYAVGENLARGYATPSEVVKGWYLSSGHKENILDINYKYTGIGCFVDTKGSLWWTQHFGGS